MASFDHISNNFKSYTEQRINRLETEVNTLSSRTDDIDELESQLGAKVENVKKDINDHIDEIQQTVISRRPHPDDKDYQKKRQQYVKLLQESTSGMDLLKKWFQNIFTRLKDIVTSIVQWIVQKVANLTQCIKNAFKALFEFFF